MGLVAIALRHVPFEDLGHFEPVLRRRGYSVHYRDAGLDGPSDAAVLDCDLLFVLGGPIGVYQDDAYPFLANEVDLVGRRLAAGRPVMGLCLGAQVMARALGARVYPGGRTVIGLEPVELTEAGRRSCLAPLDAPDTTVLHWHGDTFDLPRGAVRLASSRHYENEAFSIGEHALGLQFHPEAPAPGYERWLIGHAHEIAATPGVDPSGLRAEAARAADGIRMRAEACLESWLESVPVPA